MSGILFGRYAMCRRSLSFIYITHRPGSIALTSSIPQHQRRDKHQDRSADECEGDGRGTVMDKPKARLTRLRQVKPIEIRQSVGKEKSALKMMPPTVLSGPETSGLKTDFVDNTPTTKPSKVNPTPEVPMERKPESPFELQPELPMPGQMSPAKVQPEDPLKVLCQVGQSNDSFKNNPPTSGLISGLGNDPSPSLIHNTEVRDANLEILKLQIEAESKLRTGEYTLSEKTTQENYTNNVLCSIEDTTHSNSKNDENVITFSGSESNAKDLNKFEPNFKPTCESLYEIESLKSKASDDTLSEKSFKDEKENQLDTENKQLSTEDTMDSSSTNNMESKKTEVIELYPKIETPESIVNQFADAEAQKSTPTTNNKEFSPISNESKSDASEAKVPPSTSLESTESTAKLETSQNTQSETVASEITDAPTETKANESVEKSSLSNSSEDKSEQTLATNTTTAEKLVSEKQEAKTKEFINMKVDPLDSSTEPTGQMEKVSTDSKNIPVSNESKTTELTEKSYQVNSSAEGKTDEITNLSTESKAIDSSTKSTDLNPTLSADPKTNELTENSHSNTSFSEDKPKEPLPNTTTTNSKLESEMQATKANEFITMVQSSQTIASTSQSATKSIDSSTSESMDQSDKDTEDIVAMFEKNEDDKSHSLLEETVIKPDEKSTEDIVDLYADDSPNDDQADKYFEKMNEELETTDKNTQVYETQKYSNLETLSANFVRQRLEKERQKEKEVAEADESLNSENQPEGVSTLNIKSEITPEDVDGEDPTSDDDTSSSDLINKEPTSKSLDETKTNVESELLEQGDRKKPQLDDSEQMGVKLVSQHSEDGAPEETKSLVQYLYDKIMGIGKRKDDDGKRSMSTFSSSVYSQDGKKKKELKKSKQGEDGVFISPDLEKQGLGSKAIKKDRKGAAKNCLEMGVGEPKKQQW